MTKIYFIKQQQPEKARLLCQIIEHFFSSGDQRILLYLQDPDQALALDRFLWTWEKGSFLPHCYNSGAIDCSGEPIVITTQEENPNAAQILIMGNPCSSEFMSRFKCAIDLAEIYNESLAAQSRERFKAYRQSNFKPEMYTI